MPAPRHPLEERLAARLARWGILAETPLAVAVSGGGDSLALLAALTQVHGRLHALHVDHGLRPDSAADAEFVRNTCVALEVPCHVIGVAIPPGGDLEARARAARRAALAAWCAAHSAGWLMLGHTRDDAAETLLINLLRGGGARGLSALRPRRRAGGLMLGRPWLGIPRRALRDYLSARGLAWREDPTNASGNLRARLRHELIPALSALGGRDAVVTLARAARLLARDEAHFARQLRALVPAGDTLPLAAARALPPALRDRLLRAWFARVRPGARGLALAHLRAAARLVAGGASGDEISWPGDWRLKRDGDALRLVRHVR